jgi:ribosomal protein S18 acetylase RimI-like enzyme
MVIKAKNGKQLLLSKFTLDDADNLASYFSLLCADSKSRYGPHLFDKQSVIDLYSGYDGYLGYIAREIGAATIIAYSIIKLGYLVQDADRMQSYGLILDSHTDTTFAPSVADAWQSCGVGNSLFDFIVNDLKPKGIRRIILWGGVQASNEKAVNYYQKHGFRTLGQFEHNGSNLDMILELL